MALFSLRIFRLRNSIIISNNVKWKRPMKNLFKILSYLFLMILSYSCSTKYLVEIDGLRDENIQNKKNWFSFNIIFLLHPKFDIKLVLAMQVIYGR